MTESEAIEAIQFDLKIGGEIHSQVLCNAVDVAIQALGKQIAKKPKKNTNSDIYFCSVCERKVAHNHALYCSGCGQKLDWSDEE